MMFSEVMIQIGAIKSLLQLGVQLNLCRTSKKCSGGLGEGGGSPPHDVGRSDDSSRGAMIQERVEFNRQQEG